MDPSVRKKHHDRGGNCVGGIIARLRTLDGRSTEFDHPKMAFDTDQAPDLTCRSVLTRRPQHVFSVERAFLEDNFTLEYTRHPHRRAVQLYLYSIRVVGILMIIAADNP